MKALVFLAIANGLVADYSLIHGLRCAVSMARGSVIFSKPLAWAIFTGDQCLQVCLPYSTFFDICKKQIQMQNKHFQDFDWNHLDFIRLVSLLASLLSFVSLLISVLIFNVVLSEGELVWLKGHYQVSIPIIAYSVFTKRVNFFSSSAVCIMNKAHHKFQ
ncbi:hypothetical protein RIF29_09866 [Crotalaria pallida]|uniref:CASP-like protein n=1 Tax=Crotalaria pallida TaxID=3830 RepID=A0AAN9FVD2_CROPI